MRIIIPYRTEDYFNTEEISLCTVLGLSEIQVLNQVLGAWNLYNFGSTEDIYEVTVDEAYDAIVDEHGWDSPEGVRRHQILGEATDDLVLLLRKVTHQLKLVLSDIPTQVYHRDPDVMEDAPLIVVEKIDRIGLYAILVVRTLTTA